MYVYSITTDANETTSGTANTLDAYLAIRETSQAVWMNTWMAQGKGAGLTALSGIEHRMRHWTTVGSTGTALVAIPVRDGHPVANTLVFDGAITEGTISGVSKIVFGHGATGPGGWMARDDASKKNLEADSADEWAWNSTCGTASLNFAVYGEIEE